MSPGRLLALAAGLCALAACATPRPGLGPLSPAPGTEASAVRATVADFTQDVRDAGWELPYRPTALFETRPSLASWREKRRAIRVPDPQRLPADAVATFGRWVGDPDDGARLFRASFFGFFVPHELTHFLQDELGLATGDHARDERDANRLAVAWWMTRPRGPTALAAYESLVARAVAGLPRPEGVPDGPEADRWFDVNYHDITGDPAVYGWFQLRFVLDALAERERLGWPETLNALVDAPGRAPLAVQLDGHRDLGFHVAAHLYLPSVAITLFDQSYVDLVGREKARLGLGDDRLATAAGPLSEWLDQHWLVHRLVRLPALFDTWDEVDAALRYVIDVPTPDTSVAARTELRFLDVYPAWRDLAAPELHHAAQLAELMRHEHATFHAAWTADRLAEWDGIRRRLRDRLATLLPHVAPLDPDGAVRQLVVVLGPSLRRHGKSYRVVDGVARVAVELPLDPAREDRSILYALHELMHGFTDPLVLAAVPGGGAVSYKKGERGNELHALVEDAADTAVYHLLKRADPPLAETFLRGQGHRAWLADRLPARVGATGRVLPEAELAAIADQLRADPAEGTRALYDAGLLMHEAAFAALRSRLR